jgi:uncharacterized protein (TIRG00374 family)
MSANVRSPRAPTRRTLLLLVVLVVVTISALYVLLPALAGLEDAWGRISEGDALWLFAAAALEVLSFASYVFAFRGVFGGGSIRISWRDSYRITMAGVVATRLLAMAGAGGVALTVWALDRAGMPRREIASREATFLVLLYGLYMAALVVVGIGLWTGVLPGPASLGLTLIPALFGATVIALSIAAMIFARDLESVAERFRSAPSHLARIAPAAAAVPAMLGTGVSGVLSMTRAVRPELLGAFCWWAFDIAVLFASLRAFGEDPEVAVVVMAYFVGMLANTLPFPGGIGAVDGGMIGALIGFGVEPSLAIVAVLTYRLFAFWLPIAPGVVAYLQLLREEPASEELAESIDGEAP